MFPFCYKNAERKRFKTHANKEEINRYSMYIEILLSTIGNIKNKR